MAFLRAAGALSLLCGFGCTIDAFACSDAEQCDLRGGASVCLEDGACAYEDEACPSGYRRSARAVTDPGRCVPDETGSTSTPATSTTSSESTSTGSSETCAALDWYPDADGDGFGDADADPTTACEAPPDTVDNADDCNDGDPRVRPDHLLCEGNPGLLAWYRLDEEAAAGFALDEASKSVGTLVGAPAFGVEGAYGTASAFTGHPDSIEITEAITAITPDGTPWPEGTVELWAWAEPLDESCAEDCARFVFHVSDDAGDGFGNSTPDLHIHLANAGADTPYRWRALLDGVTAGGTNCVLAGPDVQFERWTHLAMLWDPTSCALWVDGTMADTDEASMPSPVWTRGRIGHPPTRADRAFVGRLDEVMIFDHARTSGQIRRDCGREPCPPG